MINKIDATKYLSIVKDLSASNKLVDIHAHPFEVLFSRLDYSANKRFHDLFAVNNSKYKTPEVEPIKNDSFNTKGDVDQLRSKMATLMYRRLYSHTGPRVFRDHMELSGINQTVLLPVLHPDDSEDDQIQLLNAMFGKEEDIHLGYCFPNSIPDSKLTNHLAGIVKRFDVKLVKIHPNATGIDISSNAGKKRITEIVAAVGESRLNVIIHGGLSPDLGIQESRSYARITNMTDIDWSATNEAVVIAHAGAFGLNSTDINETVIQPMKKLLSQFDNLFVDVSGLSSYALDIIFKNFDTERIFFGSDSLYFPQWEAVVRVMQSLENIFSNYQDIFVKIASSNPSKHFNFI